MERMARPLLDWYAKCARSLPWRGDATAYHVWVSEIMLQQTRVEAVKEYYARFLARLPDVYALAKLPEDELLKLWEGLGYYRRVRNMQAAARRIVQEYGGELPGDYDALLSLPGIGTYTAGAIASIAFGLPVAAVDGNVLRVLARYQADSDDISEEKVKKRRKHELEAVMPKDQAAAFNQAMMDLGAMVCLPTGQPHCGECPLAAYCEAHLQDRVKDFPKKAAAKERRIEERTVFVLRYKDMIFLRKRPKTGLLAGMYELPAAEGHLGRKKALDYVQKLGLKVLRITPLPKSVHIFTHLEWHMRAYLMRVDELFEERHDTALLAASAGDICDKYAIPSAFAAYVPYLKEEAG